MSDALMRALHVPWWVPFIFWFGLYIAYAFYCIVNGYAQEYMGWRHAGRPGKIHKVLVRFHTGAHVHPDKSYGDETYRARMAGSRGTTYWSKSSRRFRMIRNNVSVFVILVILSTMAVWPENTVRAVVFLSLGLISLWCVLQVRKLRKRHEARRPVVPRPAARTIRAKLVLEHDESTVGATARPVLDEGKPALESVPATALAVLLADKMNCSTAEMLSRLRITTEEGRISPLPDTYPALLRTREDIQEIIEAHTVGKIGFRWLTTQTPRELTWKPQIVHALPNAVRFRDHLDKIQALGQREFGVGLEADRSMYVATHNGDAGPWHCRFAGSGTGKSMGFAVKVATVAHADPDADIYCIDTKQVSFEAMRGIPGIHIYDNPQSEMDKIWRVFYELCDIMRDRYSALREGTIQMHELNDIWIFGDEGNDLGGFLKSYYRNVLGETSASPVIWGEAIGPLFRLGRQARIFGEFMFQDLTDRAMGNESLKMAFSVFGAAGFLPGQFTRTIGNPAPDCLEGPGRILMCKGNKRVWVQGFYDDLNYLHEYALENRKERKAS